ncbi:hypothetical protein QBC44DRAFT_361546 [Cladorrhinum sp. PSN332]|nr:hypothetical protein QBC44DRAFT_361546 [Cladorrhinum sp. PSN332]
MVDPFSATGLVASCFSLIACTAKAIKGLYDLKSKYDDAAADVGSLLSQISTIQSSVQILQRWLDSGPSTLQSNEQLRTTIGQALDNPLLVITAIEKHIASVNFSDGTIPARGRLRHIWEEGEVSRHQQNLDYQVSALSLLLQTIQLSTVTDQQRLITRQENQQLLRRARDTASSYIDFSDETVSVFHQSLATKDTEFDADFDFDALALDSPAYRAAFRALLLRDREDRRFERGARRERKEKRGRFQSIYKSTLGIFAQGRRLDTREREVASSDTSTLAKVPAKPAVEPEPDVELYQRSVPADGTDVNDIEKATELLRRLYALQITDWASRGSGVPVEKRKCWMDQQIELKAEIEGLLAGWTTQGREYWSKAEMHELMEIARLSRRLRIPQSSVQ